MARRRHRTSVAAHIHGLRAALFLIAVFAALCLVQCGHYRFHHSMAYRPRYSGEHLRADTGTAMITLERLACYGSCPVYTLAVYPNGKVLYFGAKNVRRTGLMSDSLGSDALSDLLAQFNRSGMPRMIANGRPADDVRGCPCTAVGDGENNHPSVYILTFRHRDARVCIEYDYHDTETKPRELTRAIIEATHAEPWISGADQ